ncbi:MAG: zinc-binding dehydrogenase [Chloroflexota bacterium]
MSTVPPPPGRAARLYGQRDLRLSSDPVPTPGPGEVLLEVTAVGLCGSDRHWYLDGSLGGTTIEQPLVLGHEIAAVIADGPEAGTRVAVEPAIPCGSCPTCRSGRDELCPTARFAGHAGTDGGLRTRMAWPRHLLRAIPDDIGDAEASVLEALGVALNAVDLGAVGAASRVAVLGCGPIGLLVILALRAAGVDDVLADEPLPHRAAAAMAAGARLISDAATAEALGQVDVVIECAGDDGAISRATQLARPGGRIVLVGIPDGDRTTFTASEARRKGLTFVMCRRMRVGDLDRAIASVADGKVDLAPLITHRYPLDEVAEAFEALVDRRGVKVVVLPQPPA